MLKRANIFFVLQGLQSTKRDAYGRLILGDIITSVNGKKVANGSDLYRILDQCKVGDKVNVNSNWYYASSKNIAYPRRICDVCT